MIKDASVHSATRVFFPSCNSMSPVFCCWNTELGRFQDLYTTFQTHEKPFVERLVHDGRKDEVQLGTLRLVNLNVRVVVPFVSDWQTIAEPNLCSKLFSTQLVAWEL